MPVKPRIVVAAASETGCVRANNEDSYKYLEEGFDFWAAVADGCGGEAAGEVASRLAVETFAEEMTRHRDSGRDLPFILRDAVVKANATILEASKEESRDGMGTTFSAVYLRGRTAIVVHAGDSRIYRKRDGAFEQQTQDHTWVQEQVKAGRMTPKQAEEDARGGILMKALGMPDFNAPDVDFLDLRPGDVFCLSSDGLHRVVKLEEISDLMDKDPAQGVNEMISLALKRGAPDNVTIILFRVAGFEASGEGNSTLSGVDPIT